MGLLFVILLWLVVGAVLFGITAIVCLVIWLAIKPKRWRAMTVLVAAPFAMGAAPVVLYLALFVIGLALGGTAPPARNFEAVFGTPPPAGVTDLQAKWAGFNDYEEIWLGFRAEPQAFDALQVNFEPAPSAPDNMLFAEDDAPPWWRLADCADREVFVAKPAFAADDHSGSSRWEEIAIVRCRDGMIYVSAVWID